MIRSFSVKNFKSFNEAEMHLAPLTLLIGPNASGKSNLLEAIRILAWLAKGNRLDDIEKTILGTDSLVRGNGRRFAMLFFLIRIRGTCVIIPTPKTMK